MEKSREQRDNEHMYMNYVYKHIKHVTEVYRDFIDDSELEENLNPATSVLLRKNLREHDQSKFSREEFNGYRQKFYPTEEELKDPEKIKKQFNYAYLHHIRYNPHHWNHWVLVRSPKKIEAFKMPKVYIIEMLIDWKATEKKEGLLPIQDFYENNKDSMILHEDTRIELEELLQHFI